MASGSTRLLGKHSLMSFWMMRLCQKIPLIPTRKNLEWSFIRIKTNPSLFTTPITWFQFDWICFRIPPILCKTEVGVIHWTVTLVSCVILKFLSTRAAAVINLNGRAVFTCPTTALHTPKHFPSGVLPVIISLPIQAKSDGSRRTHRRALCGLQ